MSGPKGYEYRVISQAELRRREDEARTRRCNQLKNDLANIIIELRKLGVSHLQKADEPVKKTHESLISWENELHRAISSAKDTVRTEQAKAIKRRFCKQHVNTLTGLTKQLSRFDVTLPEEVKQPLSDSIQALTDWENSLIRAIGVAEKRLRRETKNEASAKETMRRLNADKKEVDVAGLSLGKRAQVSGSELIISEQDDALARVATEVGKVTELLAGLTTAGIREELTRMAEQVLQIADSAQAKGDLLTLKTKASDALRAEECRKLANEVILEIAGIESLEADHLRKRAESAKTMQEVSLLKAEVSVLLEAEREHADEEFVLDSLEEVLQELGFGVGEGFELIDHGAVAVAEHADYPGYGIRVQINPENNMLYTRIVAEGATTPEDDVRMEVQTCGKVFQMADGLRSRGIAAELTLERQPGERPLDHRDVGRLADDKKKGRARTSGKQRRRRRQDKAGVRMP
jgi:hypothetical protein